MKSYAKVNKADVERRADKMIERIRTSAREAKEKKIEELMLQKAIFSRRKIYPTREAAEREYSRMGVCEAPEKTRFLAQLQACVSLRCLARSTAEETINLTTDDVVNLIGAAQMFETMAEDKNNNPTTNEEQS